VIEYRDFVPKQLSPAAFLGEPKFEALHDVVTRCNLWVKENAVEILNIETVVLPKLHHPLEQGSEDVNLRQDDEAVTPWNQFVRLWFQRR